VSALVAELFTVKLVPKTLETDRASASVLVTKLLADSVPTPDEVGRVVKLLSTVSLAGSDGYGAP
jgi:hypothetical protein